MHLSFLLIVSFTLYKAATDQGCALLLPYGREKTQHLQLLFGAAEMLKAATARVQSRRGLIACGDRREHAGAGSLIRVCAHLTAPA